MDSDDNTAIIDMKKSFRKFMSADSPPKRPRHEMSHDSSLLDSSLGSASVKGELTAVVVSILRTLDHDIICSLETVCIIITLCRYWDI